MAYNGEVVVILKKIENPIYEGGISPISILTYDGFNKVIVEKSYLNLDPFSFSFQFIGPLLQINNELDIVIYKGTYSNTIYLRVDYPSALKLMFKPLALNGLVVVPG
jgi:hypothetical protein